MATLHVTRNFEQEWQPILASKGIRAGLMWVQERDSSLARADFLSQIVEQRGIALVTTHESTSLLSEAAAAVARHSKCVLDVHVNITPDEARKYEKPQPHRLVPVPDLDAPTRTPESPRPQQPNAATTMAVMLAITNGNPLVAAAHCNNLARTAQAPVFHQARDLIIEGFPWVKAKLESEEIA